MTIRQTKKCWKIKKNQWFYILFEKKRGTCHSPSKDVCRNCIFCGKKTDMADEKSDVFAKEKPVGKSNRRKNHLFVFLSAILSVRAANSFRPSASPRMRSSQPRLWMISVSSSLLKPRLPRLNRQFIRVFLR